MTWTAEQERAHRAAQQAQQAAISAVCRGLAEHAGVNLTWQQAADIILHADTLIAILQPFASAPEPEPEQITDSVECPCGILHTKKAAGWHQTKVAPASGGLEYALAEMDGGGRWLDNIGIRPTSTLGTVLVDIKLRDGTVLEAQIAASLEWGNITSPGRITHWRLHKPQESNA
jgi:hypothetical protein